MKMTSTNQPTDQPTNRNVEEQPRQVSNAPRAALTPTPLESSPITIFNFTQYIGQILGIVQTFNANWKLVQDNQNVSLQNEINISNHLQDQTAATASLAADVANLNTTVAKVVDLLLATVNALGNVATEDNQTKIINLLNELALEIATGNPVQIAGNPASITYRKQPLPLS